MHALIVGDGHARGALAAARALHTAGWDVGVGSPARGGLAAASRTTRFWHRVPPPERGLEGFVRAVSEAVEAKGYEVVFGSGDATVLALSSQRERIPARVPYPPHAAVVRAHDKLELARAAEAVGLASPSTAPAAEVPGAGADGPVVVKARMHWTPGSQVDSGRLEARVAGSVPEVQREAAAIVAAGGEPLVQELVAGRLMAVATVADGDARPVAIIQQEADRVWPPGEGVTARGRSVAVDPALERRVAALLGELEWTGLAELQFLASEDGEPRLIDLNGRFYGSLSLAVASGANLPAIWAALATGLPPPLSEPRAGVRYQWSEGDVRCALRERRGGLGRDLLGCLAYAGGARHSVLSARDPAPALVYLLELARRGARGRRQLRPLRT